MDRQSMSEPRLMNLEKPLGEIASTVETPKVNNVTAPNKKYVL